MTDLPTRPNKTELADRLTDVGVGFRFVTGVPNGLLVYLERGQAPEPVLAELEGLGKVSRPSTHVVRVDFPALMQAPSSN